MTTQNSADRLIRNLVAQIGERPDNPVIAPRAIFLGHADNQCLDFSVDPRAARSSRPARSVEFARNEPSMPSPDGVRSGDSRYLAESFAGQSMANLTESRPLSVCKRQPALQLSLQDAIFGEEVLILQP